MTVGTAERAGDPLSSGRTPGCINLRSQDAAERTCELAARVLGSGQIPPGDEAVRAYQDGSVSGDLPVPQPGAARVEEVAVEVADADGVEREAGVFRELAGRVTPCAAVLARDEQEAAGRDEVLDRPSAAVLVIDPGVWQRAARPGAGLVYADVVEGDRLGASVGNNRSRRVAESVLHVQFAELHR